MNTREQFEAAWRKEYPLHSSTAFTRSGFDPERYANTRVQDGWLMWQAARATPADHSVPVATLHDDGYYTWNPKVDKPHGYNYAGWRMEVYAQPPQNAADHIEAQSVPVDRLDKPAQVGNGRFGVGVKWSTVIGAAQCHHEYMNTPEKERDRIAMGKEFFERFGAPQPPQPEAQSVRDAWISVDERLPEQHEWVLVSDGTWSAIGMHLDDEDLEPNKRWMDESAELIESNGIKITHWQPLPQPPKG
jgi:hypothetical protein